MYVNENSQFSKLNDNIQISSTHTIFYTWFQVWKLWIEDNLILLIEPTIYEPCYQLEILRCIQVGLLCVQEFVNDRPNVSTIISMLNSEIVDLPSPNQPGFVGRPYESSTESSQPNLDRYSANNVTVTTVAAR